MARDVMNRHVGLERSAEGLNQALEVIARLERAAHEPALANMLAAAKLVTAAALVRKESRGSHWRNDHPATDKVGSRTLLTLADAARIAAGAPEPLRRVHS